MPCPADWHFNGFAAYRIFQSNYTGNFDNNHLIGLGRKRAYCMLDTERIPDYNGPQRPAEQFTCDNQGISAGWEDIYPKYIDCQVCMVAHSVSLGPMRMVTRDHVLVVIYAGRA